MIWDAVIVGGGSAGLAAGALLGHSGLRVQVLERQSKPGGRGLTQEANGFRLNLGLHSVPNGSSGPLYRILKRIGKLDRVRFVRPELDDSWFVHGSNLHRMILKPVHFLTSSLLPRASKLRLIGFAPKLMTARLDALWHTPLGEWVQALTDDVAIHEYLLDQAMLMTFDAEPEAMSTGHFLENFRATAMARLPFFHVHQGWSAIYEALIERIQESGGEVKTGARVDKVDISEGQVQNVTLTNGELVTGRQFILAIPPQEIPNLLPAAALPGGLAERLQSLEPVGLAAMDLGLPRSLSVGPTAIHSREERIVITSYTDPSIGSIPPGGQLIQALYMGLPGELKEQTAVEQAHNRLGDVIERFYPGAHENAVVRRSYAFRNAVSVRRKVGQARVDLPGPVLPDIRNLFLAGDGTSAPGVLGNTAWASAEIAAEAVLKSSRQA